MFKENFGNKTINTLLIAGILIFAIMAVASLSMGSVDAAGNTTVDNTTVGGIKGAVSNANNYTIVYVQKGVYKGEENRNMTIATASFKRNIIVEGNGSASEIIIDAEGQDRIFQIYQGNTLTLKNLTLMNGAKDQGAAIYNYNGTLILENCIFKDNLATLYGGAIATHGLNEAGTLTSTIIKNCTFINNQAISGISNGNGGALSVYDAELNISDSRFDNNQAGNMGGAIFGGYTNLIPLINIVSSSFNGNTALSGGAIYNTKGQLNISGSNFTLNTATGIDTGNGFGGAIGIHVDPTILNIAGCIFTNNSAKLAGAVYGGDGTIKIDESSFVSNQGNNRQFGGGAIYGSTGTTMNIAKSNFTSNSALFKGGAIYFIGNQLNISDSNFNSNVGHQGGAIYTYETSAKIDNSKFNNNIANDVGGVIYNYKTDLAIENSTFNNNVASYGDNVNYAGGAIYHYYGIVTITGSNFTGNTATRAGARGGAIVNVNGTLTVRGSVFNNNSASEGGAIFNRDMLGVFDTNFTNNTCGIATNKIQFSISNSRFVDNDVALFYSFHNSAINWIAANNVFQNNDYVLAIDGKNNNISVSNSFAGNKNGILFTGNSGGNTLKGSTISGLSQYAVVFNRTYAFNNIERCTITNNQGGLYNNYSTVKVSNSNINNNLGSGSAVYINRGNITLKDNKVNGNNIGITIVNPASKGVVLTTNQISNNGIGINYGLINSKYNITVGSNVIENNRYAFGISGQNTIYNFVATLTKNYNGLIFSNAANNNRVENATITGLSQYGVVYNNAAGINYIIQADILNNKAGGIYNNNSIASVTRSNINNNSGSKGAAILNDKGRLIVTSTNFYNNKASVNGGAIANIGGNAEVSYSSFIGNSPNCAFYNENGSVVANYNWWGVNNPTGKTNFALGNYYTIALTTAVKNNTLHTGNTAPFTYYFALNGTKNNVDASKKFLYFTSNIIDNGKVVKTIDGRLSATYYVQLNVAKSNIQVQSASQKSDNIVLKVLKGKTIASFKTSAFVYKKSTPLKVLLTGENKKGLAGKTVLYYVAGKYIGSAKTNSKGIASKNYKTSTTAVKTLKVVFKGDANFKSASKSAKLKVVKCKTVPSINDFVAKKVNKKGKFQVTLKDQFKKVLSKRTIYFYIKGKLVGSAKTNSKGVASISPVIKVKGSSIKIMGKFLGDNLHRGATVTKTVKIPTI